MVTSTGTFVSCKDYDDDIDRLDQEISNVKDAIKALERQSRLRQICRKLYSVH